MRALHRMAIFKQSSDDAQSQHHRQVIIVIELDENPRRTYFWPRNYDALRLSRKFSFWKLLKVIKIDRKL